MPQTRILESAGLTGVQAEIYDYLLNNKEAKALEIAKKIKRPRGVVYKGLEELIDLGLAEKNENKGVARFRAEHPSALEKVLANKEKKVRQDSESRERRMSREKENVLASLPEFVSLFNLANNKPGVKFYEGKDGVFKALKRIADSFQPDTEIISFVKVLPINFEAELKDAFSNFIRQRIAKNVKTKVLAVSSSEAEALKLNDEVSLRETRIVSNKNLPLDFPGGEIFIYGNEICSVMIEKNLLFAFTVQSQGMAQLLKAFFGAEWSLLKPAEITPSSSSTSSRLA